MHYSDEEITDIARHTKIDHPSHGQKPDPNYTPKIDEWFWWQSDDAWRRRVLRSNYSMYAQNQSDPVIKRIIIGDRNWCRIYTRKMLPATIP